MVFERQQFTFYRSFLNIIEQLPDRKQREFMLVLIRYALNETEPNTRDSTIRAAFEGLRPILDKARNKARSGKIGGEASVENRKQNRSKVEANASKAEAEGEKEGEKEREKEVQYEGEGEGNASPQQETDDSYESVFWALGDFDLDKGVEDIKSVCNEYGEQAVLDAIQRARQQHIPRWSYVRGIVTSGGVRKATGTSRRAQDTNAQVQRHNIVPEPSSVFGQNIREMLDWDESKPAE